MNVRLLSFALVLLGCLPPAVSALPAPLNEGGKPFIESFTPDDYGAHPQNWSVTQNERGLIYVANLEGVFEYDGARWRRIEHPQRISAWSLARGEDGKIYVGASGEVGYLHADERGVVRFESLNARVEEVAPWTGAAESDAAGLGSVRHVVATPHGVYFLDGRHLLRWHEREMTVFPTPHDFMAEVGGRLLLGGGGAPLAELRGSAVETVTGTEVLADKQVTALVDFEGSILVATDSNGLFLFDGASVRPWPSEADAFGRRHRVTGCRRLADGSFVLSTYRGGIAIFDRGGKVLRVVDKSAGLGDNTVRGPGYEDAHGGLWLPLNYGLARVEVASPLEYFDDDDGLDGLVLAITRHRGTLYVGTTLGLFALRSGRFERLPGVPGCGGLLSLGTRLLAATRGGLLEVGAEDTTTLLPSAAWRALASNDGRRLYVGTASEGLHVFALRGGDLVHQGRVQGTSDYVREIAEDAAGRLWIRAFTMHRTERVERVDPDDGDVGSWSVKVYEDSRLGSNDVVPFVWRGEIYAGSPTGVFRFAEDQDRFVRDAAFVHVAESVEHVGAPTPSPRGRLWFYTTPYRAARAEADPEGRIRLDHPLDRARMREVLAFHVEDAGTTVWAGGMDGCVVRYDDSLGHVAAERLTAERLRVLIRRVGVTGPRSQLLFGGAVGAAAPPALPAESSSLRFEYALTHFEARQLNEYQSRLKGIDDAWSDWTTEAYRDFTELREGGYRFEVRGRDVHGRVSATASYDFRILAPWYRTSWAFSLYTLALAGAVALVMRGQMAKLRRERAINARLRELDRLKDEANKDLERQVHERTAKLKILSGLLPICSRCKKIRDDQGYWNKIEDYIDRHSEASFSHGMCPDCVSEVYPGIEID